MNTSHLCPLFLNVPLTLLLKTWVTPGSLRLQSELRALAPGQALTHQRGIEHLLCSRHTREKDTDVAPCTGPASGHRGRDIRAVPDL